jgi:hypothetical protein
MADLSGELKSIQKHWLTSAERACAIVDAAPKVGLTAFKALSTAIETQGAYHVFITGDINQKDGLGPLLDEVVKIETTDLEPVATIEDIWPITKADI